jgi:hypothetical protein
MEGRSVVDGLCDGDLDTCAFTKQERHSAGLNGVSFCAYVFSATARGRRYSDEIRIP